MRKDQMSEKRKWLGTWPAKCNECGKSLDTLDHFYDARAYPGSWGLFCQECFEGLGCSLGTGLGQKYNSKTLEKIGG